MLKELNATFGAVCSTVATTSAALEEGSKILRIKGIAAKQQAALEAVKSLSEAKKDCNDAELAAAIELLALVD